ncbi:MAG: hypothetical protein QXH67_00675 [Candidatus Bathyarchaeia archaeon]
MLEYEGNRAWTPVIFSEPEDALVLGATSLNSITKQLKPLELLMV